MDAASYAALLESVDVVLVPYWREIYWSRTSGIVLEAIASGKPIIVTSDTWMSDELQRWGAGIGIPNRDPRALADAIEQVARITAPLRNAPCQAHVQAANFTLRSRFFGICSGKSALASSRTGACLSPFLGATCSCGIPARHCARLY